jgi:uncharacterized protein (DUF433 family)
MVQTNSYPHIGSNPNILSGIPIIEGTRIPVRSIAGYFNLGMNAEEILDAYSYLTPAQVYAALGYYFDHKALIDSDIAENNDTERWKALTDSAIHPS